MARKKVKCYNKNMNEEIILVDKPIVINELKKVAQQRFGDMIKGVVDLERQVLAIGGDLHADEEAFLLQQGSKQENLWGINLYVDLPMPEMLEFDSMINIRPRQNNRTRNVENQELRQKIAELVNVLIKV